MWYVIILLQDQVKINHFPFLIYTCLARFYFLLLLIMMLLGLFAATNKIVKKSLYKNKYAYMRNFWH